jgi:hypothetical protein
MSSVVFKEKRLSLGLSLDKISEDLRIRKRYLEAIEDGMLDQIEFSSFYLIGYMKLYGKYLKIPEQDIADLLRVPQAEVVVYETRPQAKDPSWHFVLFSLIGMVLVFLYGKILYQKTYDHIAYAFRAKEPEVLAFAVSREDPVKEILGKYVNLNKAVILIKKSSFLKIQSDDGQLLFSGNVEAGDVQMVPNHKGIVVFSTGKDDVEIFLEDALVAQNGIPANPLFVDHKILDNIGE